MVVEDAKGVGSRTEFVLSKVAILFVLYVCGRLGHLTSI